MRARDSDTTELQFTIIAARPATFLRGGAQTALEAVMPADVTNYLLFAADCAEADQEERERSSCQTEEEGGAARHDGS
ncbi:hypothetical protein [Bradyrhizobium sp. WSM3983]|uniref:hypothetical protein n=1 Tax=Bradyrhizobium sp. WSM3983 TaxID=1038867 RepID=UPI0012ECB3B6|nr:hypothetical protein [Bradyrhizobium sp. WSM3983]